MSLVLGAWPKLVAWGSTSSLWGTRSGTSQWGLAFPTAMAPADSVPPQVGNLCSVCALLHPPDLAFAPLASFPYSWSPQGTQASGKPKPERLLACKKLTVIL